jgi:hypothetical protein
MEDYRRIVYFSGSWSPENEKKVLFIAELIARNGILVVGDHPDYQNIGLGYSARVDKILKDCSGFVTFFPYEEKSRQTTSPYMFPELVYATKHKLPLLIFAEEGVNLNFECLDSKDQKHYIATFGTPSDSINILNLGRLESEGYSDGLLEATCQLELDNIESKIGPIRLPKNTDQIKNMRQMVETEIKRFCKMLIFREETSYVFNIIPFSMVNYHKEIAKSVIYETGLRCHTAKDSFGAEISARQKGHDYIEKAIFVISDLTKLRDTCVYETGIAFGKGKILHVIKKGKTCKLPYGLDDLQVHFYKNKQELRRSISTFCKLLRRRVINFDIISPGEVPKEEIGIPPWYFEEKKFNFSLKIVLFFVLISVLSAIGSIFILHFSPEGGIGIGVGLLSVLVGIKAIT